MIPRLVPSVAPGVVSPGNVGLGAAADAQTGAVLAQVGGEIVNYAKEQARQSDVLAASRAWRQLDDWRIKYLQGLPARRKTLAGTLLDPQTGDNVTGYEQELSNFPDSLNAEHARLSQGLSHNAKIMLEERFNLHAPSWSAQAVDAITTLETEDLTGEILALAGEDRTSDAMELLNKYSDRYSPADRARIESTIAKAAEQARVGAAQEYLQGVAQNDGWDMAAKVLQEPGFQETFGVNLAEAGEIKSQLNKFVSDEKSLAEARQRAALEKANDEVLASAWDGTLDLKTLAPRVRNNEIDATVAAQAREILLKKVEGRESDDLDVLGKGYDWLRRVREDPTKRAEAVAYVRGHAGALTATTAKDLIRDIQTAGVAEDPMARVGVKVADKLFDEDYDYGAFGEVGTPEAQRAYLDVKQQWARWARQNPDASDADVTAKRDALMGSIAKPGFWTSVLRALDQAGSLNEVGFAGLDQLQAGPESIGRTAGELAAGAATGGLAMRPAPPVTFKAIDASIEPGTIEEFYETVKSLEGSPQVQQQYYEKWARKWQ